MKENNLMTPVLNDIINMNLTKKDIIEILQNDYEQELENKKNELVEKSKKLNIELTEYQKEYNNIIESETYKIKNEKYKSISKSISISVIKVYDYDGKYLKNIVIKINNWKNNYDKTLIDVININKNLLKKLIKIDKEINKLENKQIDYKNKYNNIEDEIKNISKTIRKFSAEISIKALNSSDKGKEVLKLLSQIKSIKRIESVPDTK